MSTEMLTPTIDRSQVENIVRAVLRQRLGSPQAPASPRSNLVVNISARHCHLTPEHVEALFGPGHKLTPDRWLYQEGQFAAKETVALVGPRRRIIPTVRVLGPERSTSQVELAFTDGISLGIELPVRMSGDHHDTPGGLLVGPHGSVELTEGVIRAERHVHMHPDDAAHYRVQHEDYMKLRVVNSCNTVFDRVLCRVDPSFKLEVHIDTDEGNACDLSNATRVELFK